MKIIKYILTTLCVLLAFNACSDDDKFTFDSSKTKAGALDNSVEQAYTLLPAAAKNTMATFKWSATDMGYDAIITYTLELDLVGKNFANPQSLASGENLFTTDATVGTVNSAILKLQEKYGFADKTEQNFEFRVKAAITTSNIVEPVYTNLISSKITFYPAKVDYPSIHVIGGYCDWDKDNWGHTQKVYSFGSNDDYEGWIFFDGKAKNGFKFAIPKLNNEGKLNWDDAANWGLQGGAVPNAEAASITLISAGNSGNIENVYSKNYYKFAFNKSTMKLEKKYSMTSFGIVGDGANGWGEDDIPLVFEPNDQVFTATVTLKNGGIKFRADKTWGDVNMGESANKTGHSSSGRLMNGGESKNIPVQAGNYKITVDINNSDEMTYVIEPA